MPLVTGQILNNRYRIVKLLGQGGMGAVYKAWDLNMECPRALKENLDVSPEAERQFKREAQILGTLTHPNLPKVIDHFILLGQGQYLVMEFVEGEDLGEKLQRAGGLLPEAQALDWIGQACTALEYLHTQNPPVIHRDIKPANIKITPQGKAILVDFGIAKIFDPNLSTTAGAKAVTPGYSPIEQYMVGQHTGPYTDIYALGATLYTLLTGQVPTQAPERSLGTSLPALRSLNPSISLPIETAVLKAMAMQPADRFQRAADFSAALQHTPSPPPTLTVPQASGASYVSPPLPALAPQTLATPATPRRLNWIWIVGVVALLAIAGWLATLFYSRKSQQSNIETATAIAVLFQQMTPSPTTLSPTPLTLPSFPPTSLPSLPTVLSTSPIPLSLTSQPFTTTPALGVGSTMTSPADGMVMVYVPAGEFLMGSADSDSQASSNEKPQHMVYLDAYWIDQTEVTNAQYARCVAAGKCRPPWSTYSNTHNLYYGEQQFESYPVILVSWDDAQAYCAWVSRRLPTEAEWEKAARGPYGRIYPWGNRQPGCDLANFAGCAGNTSAVGSFPAGASPYGALDVAGNVWEWVQDWYGETYYADSPSNNPDGPSSGQYRVLRGGSWNYNWWDTIRVAYRYFSDPDYRDFDFGFRCGVSPGE